MSTNFGLCTIHATDLLFVWSYVHTEDTSLPARDLCPWRSCPFLSHSSDHPISTLYIIWLLIIFHLFMLHELSALLVFDVILVTFSIFVLKRLSALVVQHFVYKWQVKDDIFSAQIFMKKQQSHHIMTVSGNIKVCLCSGKQTFLTCCSCVNKAVKLDSESSCPDLRYPYRSPVYTPSFRV